MPSLLLIDDEPDMRELVGLSLEMTTPWSVQTAGSASEALDAVRAARPDAIVLDFLMPEMDGVQLLTAIRGLPNGGDVPAVFLSGQAQPASADTLESLGVKGVIRKPFDPHALGAQLSSMLGWAT